MYNFRKILNFSPPREFSANNFITRNDTVFIFKVLKTMDFLTFVSNFVLRDYL